ncbi:MAG: hypothetical protein HN341_12780 [Verrucomicrobia bacterium]|nr:hypothetical protein [Verrucomicrobiota bacterium]
MIFFIMVLVILFFMVLWNFDLHKLLHVKNIAQNGGDAASLMAARWQGISLNVVGDLNLMQAIALTTGDADTVAAISNIQARLLFVGPMVALQASQQAAKNNGIFVNEEFSDFISDHADTVRNEYTAVSGATGQMLFPEPYPGAWTEYADMLDLVANDGVAAGPDNMQLYYDADGGHVLYEIGFYEAIAGQNWCWFHHHEPTLLSDYVNFFPVWWSPLPPPPVREPINSEFYGLHLTKQHTTLSAMGLNNGELSETADARGFDSGISAEATQLAATWIVYGGRWDDWDAMSTRGPDPFPLVGTVKDAYNYAGADAAVRIEATTGRLTPGNDGVTISNTITWTSAAKPFGYLNEEERPMDHGLVLPAFRDVRLIPVDASSAPAAGGFNLDWREHMETHLPEYMESGPFAVSASCFYCRQLQTWESASFRQTGVDWLDDYSDRCIAHGGGGRRGGGGSRRGH